MADKAKGNILVGVTGGIAAYKSPDLVRRLRERGSDVQVVLTAGGARFVTPLTFQAVSGHPVRGSLFDEQAEAAMGHIELALFPCPFTHGPMKTFSHGVRVGPTQLFDYYKLCIPFHSVFYP